MNAYARIQAAKDERRKKWCSKSNRGGVTQQQRKKKEELPLIGWKKLVATGLLEPARLPPNDHRHDHHQTVPLIILTVEKYRTRYEETLDHLDHWLRKGRGVTTTTAPPPSSASSSSSTSTHTKSIIATESCFMLDLDEFPSIGVKKIVFEGWRQNLLPYLMRKYNHNCPRNSDDDTIISPGPAACPTTTTTTTNPTIRFVLVAEDDIRIPLSITPHKLVNICYKAFLDHPQIDLLSLGHSWKAVQKPKKKKTRQVPQHVEDNATDTCDYGDSDLLRYLQGKTNKTASTSSASGVGGGDSAAPAVAVAAAGIHGATLIAIRIPDGIQKLQKALEDTASSGKQTHFDQFLFYSPHHNMNIALCNFPIVGWAEVDITLTKSSSGFRRYGGGRLGFLPSISSSTTVLSGAADEDDRQEEEEEDKSNCCIADRLVWIQRVLMEPKRNHGLIPEQDQEETPLEGPSGKCTNK